MLSITRSAPARLALIALVAFALTAGLARPAAAQGLPTSGSITVNATLVNTLTLIIANPATSFGVVAPGLPTGLVNQGSTVGSTYFLTVGPIVTVLSSTTWDGTLTGADEDDTSSLDIAQSDMRWAQALATGASLDPNQVLIPDGALTNPLVVGAVPTTYAAAAALPAVTTTSQAWVTGRAGGLSSFAQIYALNVETTDTPGTFAATVTYSASQA